MTIRVLIVDYNDKRRDHLRNLLKTRFSDYDVYELPTHPPQPPNDIDVNLLMRVTERQYDLLIGHMGGNPSGYECLKVFKDKFKKGKVILYTKSPTILIEQFNRLKLADRIFKRSENDDMLFDKAGDMMNVIEEVMKEPSVVLWRNSFKEPAVIAVMTALIGLTAAVVTFGTSLVKVFTP